MDEEDQLPEEDPTLPDPQEFREELEEGAQADQEEMSESPDLSIGEMADMGADAAAEEQLDQPPPQELPIQEQTPESPDDRPEPPPLADLAEMGQAAAEEAQVAQAPSEAPPPVVQEMEAMGSDAEVEVPPARTQTEQVKSAQGRRAQDLFEFDTGSFEADQTGMDFMQAESSYREVNFQWQRLMTAMVIDHQHRLEQLLAMLERER